MGHHAFCKTRSAVERSSMQPETRYAKSNGVHVAYQVFGEGSVDIVLAPGFVSHMDNYWSHPALVTWLERLGSFARVIMFDKRGTGLSDRVQHLPAMDERMDDFRAVLDAAGVERAALFGVSEGASLATLFAAHHPDRCTALVIYGGFARFTSWFATEEALEALIVYIDNAWGSGQSLPMFAPNFADDTALQQWWGRFERLGADPGAAIDLMRMNSQIDLSSVLPSVHVPTLVLHRENDPMVDFEAAIFLAENIPGAELVKLPGNDHLPFLGENPLRIIDEVEHFLTGHRTTSAAERVLATVLFTDIVDSTAMANRLAAERWSNMLQEHNTIVREALTQYRGVEVKHTGDGFLATFDAPARAIRCALSICRSVRDLDGEVRAGLHTGEIRRVDGDIEGLAVHIAARVSALAGPSEVLISRTVKELIAGSGLAVEPRGTHQLKGVPDEWELYQVHL